MLLFFMLSAALRAAGDTRTPLRLGLTMTVLNVILNMILIRGLGPIPALGTAGSALGTAIASATVSVYALYHLFRGDCVIQFSRHMDWRPDWVDHQVALQVRAADRRAGHRHERRRRAAAALHGLARAQRRRAGGVRDWLHRAVLDDHVDVGRPDGRRGDDRGPEPRRRPSRAGDSGRPHRRAHRRQRRRGGRPDVRRVPTARCSPSSTRHVGDVAVIGEQLLRYLAVSGFFITVALVYTGGLQGTGDTRSPLYITLASQIAIPIGLCTIIQLMRPLRSDDIWMAIVLGHFTRSVSQRLRFRQGKWRHIKVEIEGARA